MSAMSLPTQQDTPKPFSGFSTEQIELLNGPLNRQHVKKRKQGNTYLSYIEGWHAIAEANRIFGFSNWDRCTISNTCVVDEARTIGKPPYARDGWGVTYICKVRIDVTINGAVISRDGTGAGHGIDANRGQAHESAIKEAETDAMKRALMTFGNPFGLALYDKEQTNVSDEDSTPSAVPSPTRPSKPPTGTKAPKKQAPALDEGAFRNEVEAFFTDKFGKTKDIPQLVNFITSTVCPDGKFDSAQAKANLPKLLGLTQEQLKRVRAKALGQPATPKP